MADFRILVLSDLHMHQGAPNDAKSPSYLSAKPEYRSSKLNPIEGAIALLEEFGEDIDWIVCPGDIGDKSDGVSASVAWGMLEAMRRRLHARKLVGTVGNHDVDSRRTEDTQLPNEALKHLSPRFPISFKGLAERYWARDFVVWKDSRVDATLALVNTCSLHGVLTRKEKDPEHLRGYVTDSVLAGLAKQLPKKLSKFNVLVMHHHIRQHPWLSDISHAINGPKLVELLKGTGRPWLVIHGHQHLPNISYSDSSSNAPVILSAGSAAAKTYAAQGKTPRNQLYLIEFDGAAAGGSTGGGCARVLAWNWTPSVGWTGAGIDSGLARQSGFGVRDLVNLSQRVVQAINGAPAKRLRWERLVTQVAEIQYVIREDLDALIQLLNQSGITVDYDSLQIPSLFEKAQHP